MGFGAALGSAVLKYEKEEAKRLKSEKKRAQSDNVNSPAIYTATNPNIPPSQVTSYDVNNQDTKSTMDYEGFRGNVYTDTTGNQTIGYGHKLTNEEINSGKYKDGISEEQAKALYEMDMNTHTTNLYNNHPWVKDLPDGPKSAIEDMAFNMGSDFLYKWPETSKALQNGDYEGAANMIGSSKYRTQVGSRALDNMDRIRGLL